MSDVGGGKSSSQGRHDDPCAEKGPQPSSHEDGALSDAGEPLTGATMAGRVVWLGRGEMLVSGDIYDGQPALVFVPAAHRGVKGGRQLIGTKSGLRFQPDDLSHPETLVIQFENEESRAVVLQKLLGLSSLSKATEPSNG